jgi:RNA polymerase sigma factor (sigma-70 family)
VSKQLDEQIIQGCLNRDMKAQKALYQHFSSAMYAVCLRYSNTKEDAKDILQDGFVKVFSKLNQFTGKGSLEGWMKRVFVNTALEHYRVNKIYQQQSDVDQAYSVAEASQAIGKLTQKEILAVMNSMATGYRTILNLFVIEGYSHAEIAEMLGINEGTSKSQLSRARAQFIQLWNQLEKERSNVR